MSRPPLGTTNVLLPFAEQKEKWTANETNIRATRVIDRALIECRERMEQALRGLEQTPPTDIDLGVLAKGAERLKAFAKQLGISDTLFTAELQKLNDAYVAAKSEARAAHPAAGEKGKEVTRSISNAYAGAHARATLIKEALAPYLTKKPAAAKDETGEIDLAPARAPQDGDTGDATAVGAAPAADIDFTVGDADEPLSGAEIDEWLNKGLEEDPDMLPPAPKPDAKK